MRTKFTIRIKLIMEGQTPQKNFDYKSIKVHPLVATLPNCRFWPVGCLYVDDGVCTVFNDGHGSSLEML